MRFTLFAAAMAVAASAVRINEPALFDEIPTICEFSAVDVEIESMSEAELQASIMADVDALISEMHNVLAQGLSEDELQSLSQTEGVTKAVKAAGNAAANTATAAANATAGAAKAAGNAAVSAATAAANALLPKWIITGDDGKARLNPEAESVQLTNGLMCNMIKKMRAAKEKGAADYNNLKKYAQQALDDHPIFKAALEKAKRGGELALKYGVPMWETVTAVKNVIATPMDPFAYKALIEQLQTDYELAKKAIGQENVDKMANKAEGVFTNMKQRMGIPDGNTANCT